MGRYNYLQAIRSNISPIARVVFIITLANRILIRNHYLYLLVEIIFLGLLTLEDEEAMEISVEILIFLFINNILKSDQVNYKVPIFAFVLYFMIYIVSKRSIGLGDLVLNTILSMSYRSLYRYYIFFTLSFAIGAIYSIIAIKKYNLQASSRIGFVKFIVISYIITQYGAKFYEYIPNVNY